MKVKVVMKDPDTLIDAVNGAVAAEVAKIAELSSDERAAVIERRSESVRNLASRWFRYSEYLSVEIDTEVETCTVLPAKDCD